MPLASGSTFAGFTIVTPIGAGGMGEVYLATHPRLPRREALKILPAELCSDSEYRARFHREADLAAALWHPNIVTVHDRGEHGSQLWISMDYVDGTDAGRLLRDHYPNGMPPNEVTTIISAVAEALEYAHEHELLHRDVKPGNILLSKTTRVSRRILLADFGIARNIYTSDLTATNVAIGTVNYSSPEQLTGATVDARADQYALAATAYQLLSGACPYRHANPAVVIGHHLHTPPPRLSPYRPELAAFDGPLTKALAKHPAQRFSSCRDFAAALVHAAAAAERPVVASRAATLSPAMPPTMPAHPPIKTVPPPSRPPVPGSRPGNSPPSGLVAAAAILVAIALVLGLSILVTTTPSSDTHGSLITYTTSPTPYRTSTPAGPSTAASPRYPDPITTTTYSASTTPVAADPPYWDGIWLRGYEEALGDCDTHHTYWVVQAGSDADTSALKTGCFPQEWTTAFNNTGQSMKWSTRVTLALWDPDRIMSEYNRRGNLQMIGLATYCLQRAHITDFHEGPIHNDCLITPRL